MFPQTALTNWKTEKSDKRRRGEVLAARGGKLY